MKRYEYAKAGIANYWIVDLRSADPKLRFCALRLTEQGEYQEVPGSLEGDQVSVPDIGGVAVSFKLSDLEG